MERNYKYESRKKLFYEKDTSTHKLYSKGKSWYGGLVTTSGLGLAQQSLHTLNF